MDKLQTSYSDGVIEFRWRDVDDKQHFEPQVDLDLWIALPRRTALRADKLGEEVLWLGSDDTSYWLFDLLGEERVLTLGGHDQPLGDTQTGALEVRPLALLDLLGLSRLPLNEPYPDIVSSNGGRELIMAITGGGASPIRMSFDIATRLPTRVEVLDDAGEVVLASMLGRYESATKRGMAIMALPKFPQLIDIAAPARANRPSGAVKIAIEQTTTDVNEQELARVFDLERLRAGLRPQRIVDQRER